MLTKKHLAKRALSAVFLLGMTVSALLIARDTLAARMPQPPDTPFSVEYLDGSQADKDMATSPAVITQGGKIIWLAGQSGGGSPGNFEGQAKSIFDRLQVTLGRSGASLKDLVYLKVFIKADPHNSEDVVKLLKQTFPDGKYPASTIVTVSYATSLIEIQGVAVVPN